MGPREFVAFDPYPGQECKLKIQVSRSGTVAHFARRVVP